MNELVLQPTAFAQFHKLVHEGEVACSCNLHEDIESYLVFTLQRHVKSAGMASRIMALEFLEAQETRRPDDIRDLADCCLLLAGLFPGVAEKRMVRINYFVGLGVTAYDKLSCSLAGESSRMYAQLSREFVTLIDILRSLRNLNGLMLLTIADVELWQDNQSKRTFDQISKGGRFPGLPTKSVN